MITSQDIQAGRKFIAKGKGAHVYRIMDVEDKQVRLRRIGGKDGPGIRVVAGVATVNRQKLPDSIEKFI